VGEYVFHIERVEGKKEPTSTATPARIEEITEPPDGERSHGVYNIRYETDWRLWTSPIIKEGVGGDSLFQREYTIKVGDYVEARFRGKTKTWFPARVSKVHEDGFFDLVYSDGDRELEADPKHVRIGVQTPEPISLD